MIREIVVVEGIHDVAAVLRAVEAEVLATGGHAFGDDVVARLRRGHAHRGLLVLTDPDSAGAASRSSSETSATPTSRASSAPATGTWASSTRRPT